MTTCDLHGCPRRTPGQCPAGLLNPLPSWIPGIFAFSHISPSHSGPHHTELVHQRSRISSHSPPWPQSPATKILHLQREYPSLLPIHQHLPAFRPEEHPTSHIRHHFIKMFNSSAPFSFSCVFSLSLKYKVRTQITELSQNEYPHPVRTPFTIPSNCFPSPTCIKEHKLCAWFSLLRIILCLVSFVQHYTCGIHLFWFFILLVVRKLHTIHAFVYWFIYIVMCKYQAFLLIRGTVLHEYTTI